jgi:hypothetical protein
MVTDFWQELRTRLMLAADTQERVMVQFPQNLTGCVGKYGPCEYYARCWGKPPESLLYTETGLGRWAKTTSKQPAVIQTAAAEAKALVKALNEKRKKK